MSIKELESTEAHPKGGVCIREFSRKGTKTFKSEGTVWRDEFKTKKDYSIAIDEMKAKLGKEVQAKAKGVKPMYAIEAQGETTLEAVARDRIRKSGDSSMLCYFEEIIKLCGDTQPENYRKAYYATIQYLEDTKSPKNGKMRAVSTINRYKSVFRMIFNHATNGMDEPIVFVPVKIKLKKEPERDRVWTPAQKERIFAAMEEMDSWLYWPVYFSSFNPIRASDLFGFDDPEDFNPGLRKDDFKELKNWVEFSAKKTSEDNDRPTYLKQIDFCLVRYFKSLPPDIDYLFPRKMPDGSYRPVLMSKKGREYDLEWERICEKAEVVGLRWHDLKHCAITFLLDHGYTKMDLQQCGIQYSEAMINRYYHFDADKAPVIKGFEKPGLKLFEKEA